MTARFLAGLAVAAAVVACSSRYETVGVPPVASSGADLSMCTTWSESQERCQASLSAANLNKCEVIAAGAACGALYHDAIKCHADALMAGGPCFDFTDTRCAAELDAYKQCAGPNGLTIVRTCENRQSCALVNEVNTCRCTAGLHANETCCPLAPDAGACAKPPCVEICSICE